MRFLGRLFGPCSRFRFAHKLIETIQAEGETEPLTFDEASFHIANRANPPLELWLGQAYDEYCGMPPHLRAACLRKWAGAWITYRRRSPAELHRVAGELPARSRFGPT